MENLVKWCSKQIKKKTSTSLKCAETIFMFALIASAVYMLFMINEQVTMNRNYYNNNNTHIIQILTKNNGNGVEELDYQDCKLMKNILSSKSINDGYIISNEYVINCGINSEEKAYFISALDDELYNKLNVKLDIYEALSMDVSKNECVELDVLQINTENGGFEANSYKKVKFDIKGYKGKNMTYFTSGNDSIYVNEETYRQVMEIIEMKKYDTYVDDYNSGFISGTGHINRILVYVDDFDQVSNIAKKLEKKGYNVVYTLNAFENLENSLKSSKFIGFIVLVVLVLITAINMVLSSDMYLRNSQKDMGILCHYGYGKKHVEKMYSSNFKRIFGCVGFITMLINGLCSAFWLRYNALYNLAIIIPIILIILVIVYLIIRIRIKRYIKKDTLELIKFSKENE